MKRTFLIIIMFYQKAISPYLPSMCRYSPTCSSYAHEAIQRYGAIRGICIGLNRLLHCHPFGIKGYDPVP